MFIRDNLEGLKEIDAVDVGCGTGRYDKQLFDILGDKLHLYCLDCNEEMLEELSDYLLENGIVNFRALRGFDINMPLAEGSRDAVLTFNAIHHFNLPGFLQESSRVLKDKGHLFIFTRLRSQNKRNIWGRFFPKFNEKETRLYELNELEGALERMPTLELESVKIFEFERIDTLDWLVNQAVNHHYSTFSLYGEKEFEEALLGFIENVSAHFGNTERIVWHAENIMLVIRKHS